MNNTVFIVSPAIILRLPYTGHKRSGRQSLTLTVDAPGFSKESNSESGTDKIDTSGIQGKERRRETNR